MKVVALVQARRGSSRLPDKVLATVEGVPLLGWVLERTRRIAGVDHTVLATTTNPADAALVEVARGLGLEAYTGSEQDVLDRYYHAASASGADAVVRITADCPLLDPDESARVVERFRRGDADYVSNVHPRCVPDGFDTEICSMAALHTAWQQGRTPYEREHVTPHIWEHPATFRVVGLGQQALLAKLRLTVDYQEDLDLVRALYARFSPPDRASAGLSRIVELLGDEPALLRLNSRIGWTAQDARDAVMVMGR